MALPGLVLLLWLLSTRQVKKLRHLPWLSGLTLFSLVALPWFFIAQQRHPKLFDYMFIGQQMNRYTDSTYNNAQPAWFYLLALLLFFPWVFFAYRQLRWRARVPTAAASAVTESVAKAWWLLCWIWVVAIVVFFSIPSSKLVGYVLPVLPPLALLAALGWERSMSARPLAGKLFVGLCLLNVGIALALLAQLGKITRSARTQDVAQILACAARPADTVYAIGGYPYDLSFYAQTRKPLVVLAD